MGFKPRADEQTQPLEGGQAEVPEMWLLALLSMLFKVTGCLQFFDLWSKKYFQTEVRCIVLMV